VRSWAKGNYTSTRLWRKKLPKKKEKDETFLRGKLGESIQTVNAWAREEEKR